MMPEILRKSFLDNFMDDVGSWDGAKLGHMSTDIKEAGNSYEMEMELPGFRKEDIRVELKNGYLVIHASHTENKEEKNKEDKFICRERYTGQCTRRFFVGYALKEDDIKARFENGILHISIPKKEKEIAENKKTIAIE